MQKKIKKKLLPILKNNVKADGSGYLVDPETELADSIERLKNSQIGLAPEDDGTHTLDKFQINLCDSGHTDRAIRDKNMLIGANLKIKPCTCNSDKPCYNTKSNKCELRNKNINSDMLTEDLKFKSYIDYVGASMLTDSYTTESVNQQDIHKKILDEGMCNKNSNDCEKLFAEI